MSSLRSGIKQVRVERPRPLKMGGDTQPELGQEDLVVVVGDIFVTEKSDLIKVMERSVKDVERLNVELTKLGDLRRQNEFTVTTLKEEFGKWKNRALKYERTLDKNRIKVPSRADRNQAPVRDSNKENTSQVNSARLVPSLSATSS